MLGQTHCPISRKPGSSRELQGSHRSVQMPDKKQIQMSGNYRGSQVIKDDHLGWLAGQEYCEVHGTCPIPV